MTEDITTEPIKGVAVSGANQLPPVIMMIDGYGRGGSEINLFELASRLVARGHTVAAILSPREDLRWLHDGLSAAGVYVHPVPDGGGSVLGKGRRFLDFVQTVRCYPGCILHLHFVKFFGGALPVLAGRLAGAQAIVRTEHNPPLAEVTRSARLGVRLRDRWTDRILFSAGDQRAAHLNRLNRNPRKCVVVPLGIDLQKFSPAISADGVRAELGLEPTARIVGTIARFEGPRKGLLYFIDMAAEVARQCPDARFVLVGDGPYREVLEQRTRELGLEDRVVFAGLRQDVPRFLAAMGVFVMPSLIESGPYTVLEAMAMGRPVVSTPVGMVREVVRHRESGLIVPTEDSNSLACAVLEILNDAALADRLGRCGQEVIVKQYSLEAMVDNVTSVYRSVSARAW